MRDEEELQEKVYVLFRTLVEKGAITRGLESSVEQLMQQEFIELDKMLF